MADEQGQINQNYNSQDNQIPSSSPHPQQYHHQSPPTVTVPILCPVHNKLAYHYCIAKQCQCRFLQVCADCTKLGPHPYHRISSIEDFLNQYKKDFQNAQKQIKDLLDLQDINMEIRIAFQKIREEINEKLDQAEASFAKDIEILSINLHKDNDITVLEHCLSLVDPVLPLDTQKRKVFKIALDLYFEKEKFTEKYTESALQVREELIAAMQNKLQNLQAQARSIGAQIFLPFINSIQNPELSSELFDGLNFPHDKYKIKLEANSHKEAVEKQKTLSLNKKGKSKGKGSKKNKVKSDSSLINYSQNSIINNNTNLNSSTMNTNAYIININPSIYNNINNSLLSNKSNNNHSLKKMEEHFPIAVAAPAGQNQIKCLAKLNDFLVASGCSNSSKISVWDLHLGICLRSLVGHRECVNNLQVVSDVSLLSCSSDFTVKLWNWKKETVLKSYEGHIGKVWDIVLLNKKQFASCSSDGKIKIWALKDQKQDAVTLAEHNTKPVYCLLKMKNQFTLFSGGGDTNVRAWDLKTEKEIYCLQGHSDRVLCLQQINDDYIASGSVDFTINVWEVNAKWALEKCLRGHQSVVWKLVAMDQDFLISASEDKSLGVWRWKEQKLVNKVENPDFKENRAIIKWSNLEVMFSGIDGNIRILG